MTVDKQFRVRREWFMYARRYAKIRVEISNSDGTLYEQDSGKGQVDVISSAVDECYKYAYT